MNWKNKRHYNHCMMKEKTKRLGERNYSSNIPFLPFFSQTRGTSLIMREELTNKYLHVKDYPK